MSECDQAQLAVDEQNLGTAATQAISQSVRFVDEKEKLDDLFGKGNWKGNRTNIKLSQHRGSMADNQSEDFLSFSRKQRGQSGFLERRSSGKMTNNRVVGSFSPLLKDIHVRSIAYVKAAIADHDHGSKLYCVNTAYKRKANKVRPLDIDSGTGETPGGLPDWRAKVITEEEPKPDDSKFSDLVHPKVSNILRGSRLTPERLAKLRIGEHLTVEERKLLIHVLYNREAALSWTFSEIGSLRPEVAPPQRIRTEPHTAWQVPNFRVPRALVPIATNMIQERIDQGLLEPCHGPYRNPWFLVGKPEKPGKYRLINDAQHINRHTIRDGMTPPDPEGLAEECAGQQVSSLLDLFSGYDQVPLDERDRDKTAMMFPQGLFRLTRLPQGGTNSVAQFCRLITSALLYAILLRACRPYVDDIAVHGPRTRYDEEEVRPGIRRFIYEHIKNIDVTLLEVERSGFTVSGEKSQFCVAGIKIVGFICDADGRHPSSTKVIKILEWGPCTDVTSVRAFLGVAVYFRVWIEHFAIIARPLFALLKKDALFTWGTPQQASMDRIKSALGSAEALHTIIYTEDGGEIILLVDASGEGWGGVITQMVGGKKKPVRYESGLWSGAQLAYDAGRKECLGLLTMLKRCRAWLYGVRFVVETDANTLVAQLNRQPIDIPSALMTRWLAYIRNFDFDVRHVPGRTHTAADGLSRRGQQYDSVPDITPDIENIIDEELGISTITCNQISLRVDDQQIAFSEYSDEHQQIATYLVTLKRPPQMSSKAFSRFKTTALKFRVLDNKLYRIQTAHGMPKAVIDGEQAQKQLIQTVHEQEASHRGREATYRILADRYWWDGLYKQVAAYVNSCHECQVQSRRHEEEPLHPTYVPALWRKIGVDVVHMPPCQGKRYLVVARDDLSKWVEARALSNANSKAVAKFIYQDVICRHGVPGQITVDGGPENKAVVEQLAETFNIHRVQSSAYHPQGNGMVERGHSPITNSLARLSLQNRGGWVDNLATVLWADRVTVQSTIGMSPYRLVYGAEPVLGIDLSFPSYILHEWQRIQSRGELLTLRAIQVQQRQEDLEEAALKLRRMREANKDVFDNDHVLRTKPLQQGDMVLLYDSAHAMDRSSERKLLAKWNGPYRISRVFDKGYYKIEELDGSEMSDTVAGNRLKRYSQALLDMDRANSVDNSVEPVDLYEPEVRQSNPRPQQTSVRVIPPQPSVPFEEFEPLDDEDHEADTIVDTRVVKPTRHRSGRQYLVHWKDFADSHDRWYPVEELQGYLPLINEYERQHELPLSLTQ